MHSYGIQYFQVLARMPWDKTMQNVANLVARIQSDIHYHRLISAIDTGPGLIKHNFTVAQ